MNAIDKSRVIFLPIAALFLGVAGWIAPALAQESFSQKIPSQKISVQKMLPQPSLVQQWRKKIGSFASPAMPDAAGLMRVPVVSNADISDHRLEADALPGDDIRLLVWNVQKGGSDEWIGDFRTLAAESHLVLLQEAHLHPEFAQGLREMPRWDMVQAWRWRKQPTGVLTASTIPPLRVQALEAREPMLRTRKSALITEYRVNGSRNLLVANIHAINFTVDTRAFRAQLIAVADLLDEHDGPVILSGDLNTWRAERRAIVVEIADALGLREVAFDGPRKQFRSYPLDHVFFRDLEMIAADVLPVGSSDHNPLRVTFRASAIAAAEVMP